MPVGDCLALFVDAVVVHGDASWRVGLDGMGWSRSASAPGPCTERCCGDAGRTRWSADRRGAEDRPEGTDDIAAGAGARSLGEHELQHRYLLSGRSNSNPITLPHRPTPLQRGFSPYPVPVTIRRRRRRCAISEHLNQNGVVDVVSGGVITVEMCLGGRELSEPQLSPDGRLVAFVVRWGSSAAIVTVPVGGGPERLVTTEPVPAPGRGLGGGCFAWCPSGEALVYVGRDGDLWFQPIPGGPARRISEVGEGRRAEAPAVDPHGRTVAAVVDQAEVRRWEIAGGDGPGGRLDDGADDFVFDPSPLPEDHGPGWIWHAWSVPHMPWDRSRARFATQASDGWQLGAYHPSASIQQLRHLPDGRGLCVRDDTGWNNVWLGDEPLVDEPFEHAGPTWGTGQRSFAVSPAGDRVTFTRNERGFGRLCVVDVATRAVTDVARGVHGQLTWAGDRVVALRSGARTPTQIVAYDTTTWDRTVLAVGPVAGWEGAGLPEPELVEVDAGGVTLHARRYVAGAGRTLCWIHGGPTDQWQVEFLPRIAYWWSHGYDILVPDPRGSTGHGREYQQALQGEWGRLDVDDTAAILAESHRRGWSTPAHTVVIGSSSGGLAVLGVLGRHDGLAAGGVVLYR
jgi:dipeptidyl aminopeptidase/acylaminoacyl peptidase